MSSNVVILMFLSDPIAKYNVSPLIQIYNHGFKKHDIALIESIISENEAVIIDRWKEYFNQK